MSADANTWTSAHRILLTAPKGDAVIRITDVTYDTVCGDKAVRQVFKIGVEQRIIKTLTSAPTVSVVLKDAQGKEIASDSKVVSDKDWRTAPGKGSVEITFLDEVFIKADSVLVICSPSPETSGKDTFECGLRVLRPKRLICTVKSAEGHFNAYSAPPKPGDRALLDLNVLTNEKVKCRSLNFEKRGLYISTDAPYKIELEQKDDHGNFISCKLVAQTAEGVGSTSRFDIFAPNVASTSPWTVYYVSESRGMINGVIVFTAAAK